MFRLHNLFRFQYALAVSAVFVSLIFFLVYRPLSDQTVRLDRALSESWKKLLDINLKNHIRLGMDRETVSQNLLVAEKSITALKRGFLSIQQQLEFDETTVEQMRRPFQLLDYEQRRFQVIDELTRLAVSNKVAMEPSALGGLPEYATARERPNLIWAELAIAHRLMGLAITNKVSAIKALQLLPARAHNAPDTNEVLYEEYPFHLELTGTMESVLNVLTQLSGRSPPREFVGPSERPPHALFLDRMILKSVPGNPNEVSLDAVVTGFLNRASVPSVTDTTPVG